MRVIIDTNVLVSAAIADRNPEAVILFVVGNSEIEWVVSAEILTEYKEVLGRRRIKLTPDQKQRWFTLLDEITQLQHFTSQYGTVPPLIRGARGVRIMMSMMARGFLYYTSHTLFLLYDLLVSGEFR